MRDRIGAERGWPPMTRQEFDREADHGSLYIGGPETVARKIAATVKGLGLGRFQLKYSAGPLPHDLLMRSIELYGTKVAPLCARDARRDAGRDPGIASPLAGCRGAALSRSERAPPRRAPAPVREGRTPRSGDDRRPAIFHLIFAAPCAYVIVRWLAPLGLPFAAKGVLALLLLAASQFHLWNRLSSGSVFAPEFPRGIVLALNWAFGAILLLAVLQILVDLGALATALLRWSPVAVPDGVRLAAAALAAGLAALGVASAVRVPPVRDVAVAIPGLPPAFEGYRLLQLTDLHLSRLFPAPWARTVVDRANGANAD